MKKPNPLRKTLNEMAQDLGKIDADASNKLSDLVRSVSNAQLKKTLEDSESDLSKIVMTLKPLLQMDQLGKKYLDILGLVNPAFKSSVPDKIMDLANNLITDLNLNDKMKNASGGVMPDLSKMLQVLSGNSDSDDPLFDIMKDISECVTKKVSSGEINLEELQESAMMMLTSHAVGMK
jgi:hypothetical protein